MSMVPVLQIPLYDQDIARFIDSVLLAECTKSQPTHSRCISATGAHGLVIAKKDESFSEILKSFYVNLPDGMPSVWIGRLKGAKSMRRCYGPEYFQYAMQRSARHSIRHYLCGGKPGVAESLQRVCREKFGNEHIVGTFSPPFVEMTDEELKELSQKIDALQVDIVWVGLSTPKQEIFAHRLARFCHAHFICTVGAAFDFHTGNVVQAPRWIQTIGMEWFFRLLMEPKRLWKRYIEIVPKFIWYNSIELLSRKFFINRGV